MRPVCPQRARQIAARKGDLLPVSANSCRRHLPDRHGTVGERNIAQFIPVWDKDLCIQCGNA